MVLLACAALLLVVAVLLAIVGVRQPHGGYPAGVRLTMAIDALGIAEQAAPVLLQKALIRGSADEARAGSPLRSSLGLAMWLGGLRMALANARGTPAEPHVASALAIGEEIEAAGVVPRGIA